MNDEDRKRDPDYGVRLTDEELAKRQQQQQPSSTGSTAASEYGPQGSGPQSASSEYGPQGGGPQPGYQQPGYSHPGYQPPGQPQPGYQQPGYQQPPPPGYQHPGYQQQPPSGPGQQPLGGPQLHPDMAKEPERPQSVKIAFWAIVAAGIAYLITQLIVAALPNQGLEDDEIAMLEDMIGPMMSDLPVDSITEYLNSPMMTASVIIQGVITAVIYVLVALGIRHGWRSMRIVGTIFAVISLFAVSTFVSPLTTLFSVAAVILGIVGIVYSWLPASTEYFRRKAWQKAAKRAYPDMPSR